MRVLTCKRCHSTWVPRLKTGRPRRCPRCGSYRWATPRNLKRRYQMSKEGRLAKSRRAKKIGLSRIGRSHMKRRTTKCP